MTPSSPIENFAKKVNQASRSRAKDIRITMEEANEISTALIELLVKQNKLLEELKSKLQEPSDIRFSGGSF